MAQVDNQELLDQLSDTNYWLGLNDPGSLERLAGIWVTTSFAKVAEPAEYQWADWGLLKYREWGVVLAGPGIHMECGSRIVDIGPGEWYTYPPGVALRGYLYPGTVWAFIHIDGPQAPIYAKTLGWSDKGLETGIAAPDLGGQLLSTCWAVRNKTQQCRQDAQLFLWHVLHSCGAHIDNAEKESQMLPDVLAVIDIINEEPGARIDIRELARRIGVGDVTLRRHFHRGVGMPIMRYWMLRRIYYAKELLAVTRLSISNIADEAGFCDPKHFCHAFIKHEGLSPREYRKMIKSDVNQN